MEALEYLNELERMCDLYYYQTFSCDGCPLRGKSCTSFHRNKREKVDLVEQWSKENPKITMADKYIELFPYVTLTQYGTPGDGCPKEINWVTACVINSDCVKCWKQPYKKQNRTVEL